MARSWTEADFDELSWHDCHVFRLDLVAGDPDEGDWASDLALGIDFIVEWLCGVAGPPQLRLAPATLVFRGVTDPRVAVDGGDTGGRVGLNLWAIDRIDRTRVADAPVYRDRPYFRWRIALAWPAGGEIAFGAEGFTQTLLAAPVLHRGPHLSRRERARLIAEDPAGPTA
jgi:hypothetical protein